MQTKTKFVTVVMVTDPDTGGQVEVEIRKLETGLLIGLDGCFLSQLEDGEQLHSPYDASQLEWD